MIELLNHIARLWWAWTASMFWQVSLLILVIAGIDLLTRKWAWPQLRYALWSLILVKLLLPPSVSLPGALVPELGPRVAKVVAWLNGEKPEAISDCGFRIADSVLGAGPQFQRFALSEGGLVQAEDVVGSGSVWAWRTRGEGVPPSNRERDARDTTPDGVAANESEAAAQPVAPNPQSAIHNPQLHWPFYAMTTWLLGTLTLGIWLFLRLHSVAGREAHRAAAASLPPSFYNHLADCAARLGLRRIPRVAVTKRLTSPAVFGVLSPVLLMPKGYLSKLSRRDTQHMLLHELAHVKRGDLVMHSLYLLLQVVYWYNPLLWLVRRHIHHLRELSCDGTVAELLREGTLAYRQTLLDTARRMLTTSVEPGLGLLGLFEDSNYLLVRLHWLTKPTWRYSTMKRVIVATTAVLMFVCVLPMAQAQEAALPQITKVSNPETVPVRTEGDNPQQQDQLSRDIARLETQLRQLMAQQQDLQNQLQALAEQRYQLRTERKEPAGRGGEARGRYREQVRAETRVAPAQPTPPGGREAMSPETREQRQRALEQARVALDEARRAMREAALAQQQSERTGPAAGAGEAMPPEAREQLQRAKERARIAQDEVKRLEAETARMEQQAARAEAQLRAAEARGQGRQARAQAQRLEQWEQSEPMQNWQRDMENWGRQMEDWGQEFGRRQAAAVSGSGGESAARERPPMPPMPPMPEMPSMPPMPEMPSIPPVPPEIQQDGGELAQAVHQPRFGPISGDRPLEIKNIVGSITVRSTDTQEYTIRATITGKAQTADRAREIAEQVVLTDTGVQNDGVERILVSKPEGLKNREGVTVAIEVTAPRDVRLKLGQEVGDIRLTGLRGAVDASTRVGTIRAVDVAGQIALNTDVGDIEVLAPKDLSARVEVKTNIGSVQSDFPLDFVKPRGVAMGRSATGSIGSGAGELSVKTNVGSIRIRAEGAESRPVERNRSEPRPRPEPRPAPTLHEVF